MFKKKGEKIQWLRFGLLMTLSKSHLINCDYFSNYATASSRLASPSVTFSLYFNSDVPMSPTHWCPAAPVCCMSNPDWHSPLTLSTCAANPMCQSLGRDLFRAEPPLLAVRLNGCTVGLVNVHPNLFAVRKQTTYFKQPRG